MTRLLAFTTALVLAVMAPAWAQISAEGSIRGIIHDEQGGILPGVIVTATSPQAPRPVTATTDAEGTYRLQNLLPGEYTVTAELEGFTRLSRTGINIAAGLNLTIDIAMKVGSIGETIQVVADTPMLESERSSKTVNISGELQRSLPLTTRKDFSDYLEVTPGVTARGFDQASGGQVYMLRGTDIENHVTQIDGADMGSFRQNWAGLYMGLSTDAVQDVQVKTGGADASSPLGLGVITQVSTPSGTDLLKGSGSFVYTAKSWNGNNTLPGETPAIQDVFQPDLSAGGPIWKGNAWFFGAFRYVRRNVGISRDAAQVTALQALQPGFESFQNQSRSKYYYLKGTTQLGPKHNLYGFYQYDQNPDETNWAYSAQKLNVSTFGGLGVGTRLTSIWGDHLTTKVLAAYNNKSLNGTLDGYANYPASGPGINVYNSAALSAGRLTGAGQIAEIGNLASRSAQPATKFTFSADTTYLKSGWAGSHEFQAGVYMQNFDYTSTVLYSNFGNDAPSFQYGVLRNATNPALGYQIFNYRVYDRESVRNADLGAHDYAIYIQDAWKPMERLTLNLGLRLDQITATDRLFDVGLMDAWHLGPRFGVTYALTEDRKNILRGTWGRVHDIPNSTYFGSAGSATAGYIDYFDNDLNGSFETVLPQPAASRVSSDRQIDPDRHQAYINEWLVGYQKQLPGQMAVDVSWVNRGYMDRPANVEVNGIYDGGVFSGVRDISQNLVQLVTNNEWNWFVYNGFELTVSKRTKSLSLLGSYGRNFQHIAGDWQPNDPASFIQPTFFDNDRGLGTIRGDTAGQNSLSGTDGTRSPSWQKHVLRIGGSYIGPWQVTLGASYSLQSGPYTGPVVTRIAAADPAFGPATIVLSNGRSVSNPLATNIRFAGTNRGDAQIEADAFQVLNLSFGKDLSFGKRKLSLMYQVFNAMNGDTYQQFKSGGNQLYSPNYGVAADGSMQGQSRQFARSGQLSVRFAF